MPPELGYPENDYNKSGPRPTTFSVLSLSLFDFCKISFEVPNLLCLTGPTSFGFCAEEPRID